MTLDLLDLFLDCMLTMITPSTTTEQSNVMVTTAPSGDTQQPASNSPLLFLIPDAQAQALFSAVRLLYS